MRGDNRVTWSLLEMATPVPYMSAMTSEPGRADDDVALCGTRCILSRPRSCRLRDTVISAAADASALPAAATEPHTTNCYYPGRVRSGKRNATVNCLASVRLSRRHTQRDSPGSSMRRGQRTFRAEIHELFTS